MKVNKISVSITRKISLGNYNMVELGSSAEGSIEDNENVSDAYSALRSYVKEDLKALAAPYRNHPNSELFKETNDE